MIEALEQSFRLILDLFVDGFVSLLAIAIAGPFLGALLVLRRMPLVGLAGPQLAGCGQAAAHWLFAWIVVQPGQTDAHPNSALQLFGAAVAVTVGLVAIGFASRDRRFLGVNAAIAWIVAIALQELFYLHSPFLHAAEQAAHHGQLLTVTPNQRNLVLVCAAVVIVVGGSLWRRLWITAFDADQGRLLGFSPRRALTATLLLLGGFCAVSTPAAGPLATLTLIVIPPAILRVATPSLAAFAPLSITAGLAGSIGGMLLACCEGVDWPPGPAITVCVIASSTGLALLLRLLRLVRRLMRIARS